MKKPSRITGRRGSVMIGTGRRGCASTSRFWRVARLRSPSLETRQRVAFWLGARQNEACCLDSDLVRPPSSAPLAGRPCKMPSPESRLRKSPLLFPRVRLRTQDSGLKEGQTRPHVATFTGPRVQRSRSENSSNSIRHGCASDGQARPLKIELAIDYPSMSVLIHGPF